MLFVSFSFLFLFLPGVLGVYYLFRSHRKLQNILLFLASLFFYACGEPKFVVLLLTSIFLNWLFALMIERNKGKGRLLLGVAVITNIGILFVFKYCNAVFSCIGFLCGGEIINSPFQNITLPIGISFFTFQALSYVIDVYRGEQCQKNLLYVGLYISFFPQLIAGPIVRYHSIANQLMERKETIDKFEDGIVRFIQGFCKKILLANTMAIIADKAFNNISELTVSFAWLGALCYTLQIFFDFSGYSDMAIGLGKMFGFEFEENFNYPYMASSVTEFWRRWHISLSNWFRDYVYIPLGGNRTESVSRNYFNLFVVWLLTGVWHGAHLNFALWGMGYFVLLVLEKATSFGKIIQKRKWIGHIYTLFIVMVLWVIFRAGGIQDAIQYIQTMFGLTEANLFSSQTWIYIKENIVYLFFAILLSTNICGRLKDKIFQQKEHKKVQIVISVVGEMCLVILFVISIVYIINGTYNPFIYFNF